MGFLCAELRTNTTTRWHSGFRLYKGSSHKTLQVSPSPSSLPVSYNFFSVELAQTHTVDLGLPDGIAESLHGGKYVEHPDIITAWSPDKHGDDGCQMYQETCQEYRKPTSVLGEFAQDEGEGRVCHAKTDHHQSHAVDSDGARDESLENAIQGKEEITGENGIYAFVHLV